MIHSQLTQEQNYRNLSKFSQKKKRKNGWERCWGRGVEGFPGEKEKVYEGVKTAIACIWGWLKDPGKS